MGNKFQSGNFLNTTNNRVESFNSKVKKVLNHNNSLESFVKGFFQVCNSLRNERNHNAVREYQTVNVRPFLRGSTEDQYAKLLTSYAANFVFKGLSLHSKVELEEIKKGRYCAFTPAGQITVTSNTCHCLFYSSMKLPCKHIFKCREMEKLPLYEEDLCSMRWTKKFYLNRQRSFIQPISNKDNAIHVMKCSKRPRKDLNENERFREANNLCSLLSSLVSECGGQIILQRMSVLQELYDSWSNNDEVCLKNASSCKYSFNCIIFAFLLLP